MIATYRYRGMCVLAMEGSDAVLMMDYLPWARHMLGLSDTPASIMPPGHGVNYLEGIESIIRRYSAHPATGRHETGLRFLTLPSCPQIVIGLSQQVALAIKTISDYHWASACEGLDEEFAERCGNSLYPRKALPSGQIAFQTLIAKCSFRFEDLPLLPRTSNLANDIDASALSELFTKDTTNSKRKAFQKVQATWIEEFAKCRGVSPGVVQRRLGVTYASEE